MFFSVLLMFFAVKKYKIAAIIKHMMRFDWNCVGLKQNLRKNQLFLSWNVVIDIVMIAGWLAGLLCTHSQNLEPFNYDFMTEYTIQSLTVEWLDIYQHPI